MFCQHCGFNLAGSPGAFCPGCGVRLNERAQAPGLLPLPSARQGSEEVHPVVASCGEGCAVGCRDGCNAGMEEFFAGIWRTAFLLGILAIIALLVLYLA